MRIAVLEDDHAQLDQLCLWLAGAGHVAHPFSRGRDLLARIRRDSFDLVTVDWELPDIPGLEVMQWIRRNVAERPPVIFVTQRDAEEDVVAALGAGADDYVPKPVQRAVLLARIGALLRRAYPSSLERHLSSPPFEFDAERRIVTRAGEPLELRAKEFDLALALFRNPGRVLSRAHLLETIWAARGRENDRTIDTHVSALRSKLGLRPENGYRVVPVYGYGYRLEPTAAGAGGIA